MNTFTCLEKLEKLNLDSNEIFSLNDVQFNLKLVSLSLQFNMLTNLSEIDSNSLEYLFISNNRIQTLNSISNLPNLEYLDLSQNRLIKIEENSFLNLFKLRHLNLSFNKLDLENGRFKNNYLETLDLSFNEIKYLDSNSTLVYLNSLNSFNLSNNRLKMIDSYLLRDLRQLKDVNLASNNLKLINENSFFDLKNLTILRLSFNQIESLEFLRKNKAHLKNLANLDLDHNNLISIDEFGFEFNKNLTYLNLNANPIEFFHVKALENLKSLETLKLSQAILNNSLKLDKIFLKKLDLSYLNVSLENASNLTNIEWINVAKSNINISFGHFLSNQTKYVDFSHNQINDFKMFKILGKSIETLKLSGIHLEQVDQINFTNIINIKYLDLSMNNLTHLNRNSFESNTNLEYLDLSWNKLEEFYLILKKLKYLNLENNQIKSINSILFDYFSIGLVKMGNNFLQNYPSFEMSQINNDYLETFFEIDLSRNQIKQIKYFSFMFGKLKIASFDSNNISFIQEDAFLNCRSLEYLSIANNSLTRIAENNFHFLFSLIYLNLSRNEIDFIENNSFKNLNKLKSFDLNYNNFKTILNDLFIGLTNLNDLFLLSRNEMILSNQSFKHLPNISNLYLNESLISKYKCLFMHDLQRDLQRRIPNKYIFYKVINLITNNNQSELKCDLIFQLFQFKIHFNLKTDYENEQYFDLCQKLLIKTENNFNHTLKKCFTKFKFEDRDEEKTVRSSLFFNDLSRIDYLTCLFIVFLTMLMLFTAFFFIVKYELLSDNEKEMTKYKKQLQNELDLKIERKREKLNKFSRKIDENKNEREKEMKKIESVMKKSMQKLDEEISILVERKRNLQDEQLNEPSFIKSKIISI